MIGWSSRNSRDRKRRAQWWASLTEEEKSLETRREAVADRWFFYVTGGVFLYLLGVWALVPGEWSKSHPQVVFALFLLGHPGGMVIGVFVGLYKKRRVQ